MHLIFQSVKKGGERMTLDEDTLLDRKTVAKLLHVKPGTLATWAWRKKQLLPVIKIGRVVRYRRSDVEALIKRNLA